MAGPIEFSVDTAKPHIALAAIGELALEDCEQADPLGHVEMHAGIDPRRVLRGRGTGTVKAAPGAAVRKESTVRSVSNSWRQATRTKGRRTRSLRSAIQESNWMPSELTSESTEWESKVRPKIPGPPSDATLVSVKPLLSSRAASNPTNGVTAVLR